MEELVSAVQGANLQGNLQGDVGITAACDGEMLWGHPCSSSIAAEKLQSPGPPPLQDQLLLQAEAHATSLVESTHSKISTRLHLKGWARALRKEYSHHPSWQTPRAKIGVGFFPLSTAMLLVRS